MAAHWSSEEVWQHLHEIQLHKPFTIGMEKWFPLEPAMTVLEPGSGTGSLSAFVAKRWQVRAICLDFIAEALSVARKKFLEEGVTADLIQADIRYLPFKDGAIDLVFNQGVIEHFAMPDRQAVVDEMARVSRKYVAIFVPNSLNPFRAIAKRIQMWQGRWRLGLELPYSPWELKRRLKKAGITTVKRGGVNFFKNFYTYWPFRLLQPLLRRILGDKLYAINASDGLLSCVFADELFTLGVKDSGKT